LVSRVFVHGSNRTDVAAGPRPHFSCSRTALYTRAGMADQEAGVGNSYTLPRYLFIAFLVFLLSQ
jgi:hypothetical protein